ncbi:hypothetical protein [Actinoplanes sp. NPDC048796]|uniref:hypothetical protein n=1 Tax=unclassified Actinoplanes TaxID=2626549 RepID=UPI00340F23E4
MTTPQPPDPTEQPSPWAAPDGAAAPGPYSPGLFTDSPAPGQDPRFTPVPAYEQEAPRRRTGYLPLLLTGLAGLLVGALIVGVVWAASASLGGTESDADADARASCEILDRLPGTWTRESFDLATTNRLAAAFALAAAAAKQDSRYQTLAEAEQNAHQAALTFQLDLLSIRVREARNACDKL